MKGIHYALHPISCSYLALIAEFRHLQYIGRLIKYLDAAIIGWPAHPLLTVRAVHYLSEEQPSFAHLGYAVNTTVIS